jgi:hypothetical protein
MKNVFTLLVVHLLLVSAVLAQMQLKLPAEIENQNILSVDSKILNDFQSIPPNFVTSPSEMMNFYKGMIIVGLMADLTIPIGDEFKLLAGTGFSAHVMAGYMITNQFLLALRAGYIKFGTQTEEGTTPYVYSYEDSYSQIPILLGAYYILAMQGNFKPYLGASFGMIFQTYSVNQREQFGSGIPDYTFDESFSESSFVIVPGIGVYYLLSAMMIHFAVEYNLLLKGIPQVVYDYNYSLGKVINIQATTATNDDIKANSLSFLLGLSIPIGGN